MMSSLFSRLTTSLAAISMCTGFAFLAGCDDCDDGCEKAQEVSCCEGGTVHEVEYLPAKELRVEQRPVIREESRTYDTSIDRMSSSRPMNAGAENMLRERLVEIERERVLYPERAAQLDTEAAQINRDLNINVNADRGMQDRSFEQRRFDRDQDVNINVRDHSDVAPAARDTSVKQDVNVNVDRAAPPASDIKTETKTDVNVQKESAVEAQDSSLKQDSAIKTESELKSDAEFKADSAVKTEVEKPAAAAREEAEIKTDNAVKTDAELKADEALKSDAELKSEVKKETEFKSETSTPAAPASDLNQQTEVKKETETKVDAADGEVKTETKTEEKTESKY
jgi:hypothetical protein